jgi:hypothetical protein
MAEKRPLTDAEIARLGTARCGSRPADLLGAMNADGTFTIQVERVPLTDEEREALTTGVSRLERCGYLARGGVCTHCNWTWEPKA